MALIVIDAGHGGDRAIGRSSPLGCRGPGGALEKDVTLAVASRVAARFGTAGVLTRTADVNRSLAERAAVARQLDADVFLSIHAGGSRRGTEVWIHELASAASRALAAALSADVFAGKLAVLDPSFHAPSTAACLAELDGGDEQLWRGNPRQIDHVANELHRRVAAYLAQLQPRLGRRDRFPWIGRIQATYAAALRRTPRKDPDDPHRNTMADLPRDHWVTVLGNERGWLRVRTTVNGEELEGYVSHELVAFNRYTDDENIPLRQALVILKRAQVHKAANNEPAIRAERNKIDRALQAVKAQRSYRVDEATYQVAFAHQPGIRTKVSTIEDFVLFVEEVEATYPTADIKDVVSEVRQLWFSDPNWELLVASQGIKDAGVYQSIEDPPNRIAVVFDMGDLAPDPPVKVFATVLGNINIGHVMAGIDARLSGFPSSYPRDFLAARGHDSAQSRWKYEVLKQWSRGDTTMWATFAGDLGQAYAIFIYDRYARGDQSAKLVDYTAVMADAETLRSDLHGYIATEVAAAVRAAGSSPTGNVVSASSILRDMYLTDKSSLDTTAYSYLEKLAGSSVTERVFNDALLFAHIWYANHDLQNTPAAWSPADLFDDSIREFAEHADRNERLAPREDTLRGAVEDFVNSTWWKLS